MYVVKKCGLREEDERGGEKDNEEVLKVVERENIDVKEKENIVREVREREDRQGRRCCL